MANAFQDAAEVIARLNGVAINSGEIVTRLDRAEAVVRQAGVKAEAAAQRFEALAGVVQKHSAETEAGLLEILKVAEQQSKATGELRVAMNGVRNEVASVRQEFLSVSSRVQIEIRNLEDSMTKQIVRSQQITTQAVAVASSVSVLIILTAIVIAAVKIMAKGSS